MNPRILSNQVSAIRGRSARAFSLIELLVVISIIAVLAGLVVGVAPVASKRMREARIRAELAALVTAIESYKAK
ncbi:MAG: type II secretion system protein, partial [Verrucomicrobiota bacterium]